MIKNSRTRVLTFVLICATGIYMVCTLSSSYVAPLWKTYYSDGGGVLSVGGAFLGRDNKTARILFEATTSGKKDSNSESPETHLVSNFSSGNTTTPGLTTAERRTTQTTDLPLCSVVPPRLNGPLATYSEGSNWTEIALQNPGLGPGGRYRPPDCQARHRVAIIIPYRNRERHLRVLLRNLHPMLARQQLDYGVYVVEQALPGTFNRGMLMNIGFVEAMKRADYQCAIFHDVDLIPEDDRNLYTCPDMPRHMSAAIDKFNYVLPFPSIFGGVTALNKKQFTELNGFSNLYFGWGGEDDDLERRVKHAGFKVTRYSMKIARYRMIKHHLDKGNELNPQRFNLLKNPIPRMIRDGLSSLKYSVQVVEELPTHLRIQVFINQTLILQDNKEA